MKGYQFSLRTLLAAMAAVGIGAGLWAAEPSWQVGAVESIIAAWILASTVTLIVHSTGKAKAFWIGVGIHCTLSLAILMAGGGLYTPGLIGLRYFQVVLNILPDFFRTVFLAWAFAPVVGLLCVFTHWLLIRPPQGPQD